MIEVPITVNLSDSAQAQGLKVFEKSSTTAKVSIKGNSAIISQIKAKDLQVVADLASSINKPCNMALPLSVRKSSSLSDYEATIDPSSIIVSVDYYKEKTLKIVNNIKYKVGNDYYSSDPVLSTDSVTVTGPESEVSKVAQKSVEYEINDVLTETKKLKTQLILYDNDNHKFSSDKIKLSASDIDVTIGAQKADNCIKCAF